MFVRIRKKDESRWQLTIVESVRVGREVKQKTVRNIGTAYSEKEVNEFKKIGEAAIVEMRNKAKPVLSFVDPAEVYAPRKRQKPIKDGELVDPHDLKEEKRLNEGFYEVFSKIYEDAGLGSCISGTRSDEQYNEIIKSVVIARIAEPRSKIATLRLLDKKFDIKIPFQKIYRSMDKLIKFEDKIKSQIKTHSLGLFEDKVDVLFFDVTTLYFESISSDELKNFGFSKDCKFKEVQVMLALITTQDGLPVGYRLFPGNTFEGQTLQACVTDLKNDFDIENFVFVADRGMFSKKNLQFLEENKINYVVGASLKKQPASVKNDILSEEYSPSIIAGEFQWLHEFNVKSRRLIVSYSSKRAKKDFADRQRLVERLLKKSKDKKINVKDLISNYGTKKYVQVTGGKAYINEAKISEDAEWDGLHGIITNKKDSSAIKLLERYRGLWQIEEAFRVNKHSLKMRPIFHWTPRRIKAHIMICYMAYSLLKYTQFALKKHSLNFSPEQLRDILEGAQASILLDTSTKKKYVLPSPKTNEQELIYKAFGLSRSEKVYAI